MTPKEKAQQLADYYMPFCSNNYNDAKQCALIAVDEIINSLPPYEYGLEFVAKFQYWLDVKTEIDAL